MMSKDNSSLPDYNERKYENPKIDSNAVQCKPKLANEQKDLTSNLGIDVQNQQVNVASIRSENLQQPQSSNCGKQPGQSFLSAISHDLSTSTLQASITTTSNILPTEQQQMSCSNSLEADKNIEIGKMALFDEGEEHQPRSKQTSVQQSANNPIVGSSLKKIYSSQPPYFQTNSVDLTNEQSSKKTGSSTSVAQRMLSASKTLVQQIGLMPVGKSASMLDRKVPKGGDSSKSMMPIVDGSDTSINAVIKIYKMACSIGTWVIFAHKTIKLKSAEEGLQKTYFDMLL
jgi:hypothetical protein